MGSQTASGGKMTDQSNPKVVNISTRRERWHTAYTLAGLNISVSSNGRLYVQLDGKEIFVDMTDSVDMLGRVSEKYERIVDL
jgi:hypothetical protein